MDLNRRAAEIVREATGGNSNGEIKKTKPRKRKRKPREVGKKNPAAVSLGRLGGLKGGKARAVKLREESPERIVEIAREGGLARQRKRREKNQSA